MPLSPRLAASLMYVSKELPKPGRHPLSALPKGQTFLTLFNRLPGTVLWRNHYAGEAALNNEVVVMLDRKGGGTEQRGLSPNVVVYVPPGEAFRPPADGTGSGVRRCWK